MNRWRFGLGTLVAVVSITFYGCVGDPPSRPTEGEVAAAERGEQNQTVRDGSERAAVGSVDAEAESSAAMSPDVSLPTVDAPTASIGASPMVVPLPEAPYPEGSATIPRVVAVTTDRPVPLSVPDIVATSPLTPQNRVAMDTVENDDSATASALPFNTEPPDGDVLERTDVVGDRQRSASAVDPGTDAPGTVAPVAVQPETDAPNADAPDAVRDRQNSAPTVDPDADAPPVAIQQDDSPSPTTDRLSRRSDSSGGGAEESIRPETAAARTATAAGERTASVTESTPATTEESDVAPNATSQQRTVLPSFDNSPVAETTETRSVRIGTDIEVRLPGRSWLYLGSEPPVAFLGRRVDEGGDETIFTFRVEEPAVLRFESQDLRTGERRRHEERITLADADDTATTAATPEGTSDRTAGPPTATGQAVPQSADESGAISDGARDGNEDEDLPVTPVQYVRSVSQEGFDTERHETVLAAVRSGDRSIDALSVDELISYIDAITAEGFVSEAATLLEALTERRRGENDAFLYRLAQLYEGDETVRDIRRARQLYQRLVDTYPFSEYYRSADERIRFLNRHFFYIR